jgi:hypothetical protein
LVATTNPASATSVEIRIRTSLRVGFQSSAETLPMALCLELPAKDPQGRQATAVPAWVAASPLAVSTWPVWDWQTEAAPPDQGGAGREHHDISRTREISR